jgi:hypothetical protein
MRIAIRAAVGIPLKLAGLRRRVEFALGRFGRIRSVTVRLGGAT